MPVSGPAPKATSTARRKTNPDSPSRDVAKSKPKSFHEATTVQDRVKQWQAQHNFEAVDPDSVSVASYPRSEACRTPVRAQSPAISQYEEREAQTTPRRRSTKWVQQDNQSWIKQRKSVRVNRRKSNDHHVEASEVQVVPKTPTKESSRPVAYTRTESQRVRDANSSRVEREERKKRRREARARADGGAALVDDGIRVYMKSETNLVSELDEAESVLARSMKEINSRDEEQPQYQSQLSFDHDGPLPSVVEEEPDEDRSPVQPSRYAQTLGRPPEYFQPLEQPKTRKRALFSKTKEILTGRNDLPPAHSNRITSIEAWLDEQPTTAEALLDDEEDIITPLPSDIPKPLKSRKKKIAIERPIAEVVDPNKIWESIGPSELSKPPRASRKSSSRQQTETASPKRRLFSFEVGDEGSKGEECIAAQDHLNAPEARTPARRRSRPAPELETVVESVVTGLARENSIQPDRDISPKKIHESAQEIPVHGTHEDKRNFEPDDIARQDSKSLKRKLTTHEDLLSVLSQPRARKSTRSVRSVRQNQPAPNESVIREALQVMQEEELKYARELRTLVDGVTPVLLQSLLSRSDTTITVGLFGENVHDTSYTRPIIDMGVALQRLKNLHQRIQLQEANLEALLTWAITAQKSYSDYIKSWRLGFQGVIVNLAPLDESKSNEEEMLARDLDGDVTDENGQKVDVAYLQKRPLIRIKRFAKFFATVRDTLPENEKAAKVAEIYDQLMEAAKRRHSDEQGRLEDEAAAAIDSSRARDIRTMAPLQQVEVDRTRKVRARDYFDLSIYHSTGQRLDCRIEIVLRDDALPSAHGGDILICQVDQDTKWLLFQPLILSNVSIRRDQAEGDLVLMAKGTAGISQSWHELLALRAEDLGAATEWLHMIGSNPLPPKLNHLPSWHESSQPATEPEMHQEPQHVPQALSAAALANIPSDVDVPLGEPSVILRNRADKNRPLPKAPKDKQHTGLPILSLGGGLQRKNLPDRVQHAVENPHRIPQESVLASSSSVFSSRQSDVQSKSRLSSKSQTPGVIAPLKVSTNIPQDPLFPQQRYSPQKFSQVSSISTETFTNSCFTRSDLSSSYLSHVREERERPRSKIVVGRGDVTDESLMSGALPSEDVENQKSTPSKANPAVKTKETEYVTARTPVKNVSQPVSSTPLTNNIREQWAAFSKTNAQAQNTPTTPKTRPLPQVPVPRSPQKEIPLTVPVHQAVTQPAHAQDRESLPPPPPAHRSTYTISSPQASTVDLTRVSKPEAQSSIKDSASANKDYHAESSASSDESEDEDDTDATSELSDVENQSELKDQPTPLIAVGQGNRRSSYGPARPLPTVPSTGTRTLDPSDSASNGPYRKAPPPNAFPAHKKKRTIAMVCSWSDRGIWEPIQDDECSIVISPGLVQAFPVTAAHSQPMQGADWEIEDDAEESGPIKSPLVEFELTPIVPLRKGTALDITIRSPPTSNSTLRTTNNVMFRSRTVQECEKLYQLINWARCNNPTYAQLVRSRAREEAVVFATNVPQTRTRSWFSFGSREKGSYRAPSRPPTSIADSAATGSSATSAFSALKKFGKNSPFSLKRSSVVHRPGMAPPPMSLYSSTQGGSGSGSSTPAPASQAGFIPGPDGPNVPQTSAEAVNGGGMVNNMKVRLFLRRGQKWEALGQSLLTVLPATTDPEPAPPNSGNSTPQKSRPASIVPQARGPGYRLPSSSNTPHRIHGDGREKRVLVTSAKRKEIVLLDEILGESCFEKVMQTGIAINVWKEDEQVQDWGGVMTGRSRMYMIQFRTSTEASWVFNMCGSYRYGNA